MIGSLIIYSSTDGHTKAICKRIIDFLKDRNKTRLVSLNEAKNLNLAEFDKIIIGAIIVVMINMGQIPQIEGHGMFH